MNDINILKENGVDLNSSLEFLGDMETYDETLRDFLNYISDKANDAARYKDNRDAANYAIIAHSIKSDAKYLGFKKLADIALNHELEGKNNNLSYIDEHFNEFITEIKNVIKVSLAYLKNQPIEKKDTNINMNNDSILIVDDSDMVLSFISKVFNNTFNCILASDGRRAIQEITKDNNIKAILLDLNMPNVNGFEVLDYLKNNNLLTKYPVSIITGADDKDTINKAFNYGIVDMLQKPFNERDVKRIIERTINYGK